MAGCRLHDLLVIHGKEAVDRMSTLNDQVVQLQGCSWLPGLYYAADNLINHIAIYPGIAASGFRIFPPESSC
jgi:hypothetical protein